MVFREKDKQQLLAIASRTLRTSLEIWVYGSRVNGDAHDTSDLDLVLRTKDLSRLNHSEFYAFKEALEESTIPILVQVFDWVRIPESFRQNIERGYEVLWRLGMSEVLMENGELTIENGLSEWREKPLKEVAQLRKDGWKVGAEPLPYIALEHIVERGLRIQGLGDSATIASNKYRFNSDSFLFGKLRPYFRKLYKPDFDGICSTNIWVVEPKDDNNKDYLFYFFANQEFIDLSCSSSSGTRMPRADWKFISEQKWYFPPLSEQKAIAQVLSVLDDKIDLLYRQNKTLEQMAETLFRQWFVVEAGEDWEEGVLSDLVEVKYGKDHKKLQNGKIPIYGSGGVMRYAEKSLYEDESVLIPRKGTLNNVVYIDEPFWTVDTMFYTIMKRPNIAKFIYQFIKEKDLASMNVGSAVPSITTQVLNSMSLLIPSDKDFDFFENSVVPYYQKIKENQKQISTLQSLRDTLLPKLMSGEVRVDI